MAGENFGDFKISCQPFFDILNAWKAANPDWENVWKKITAPPPDGLSVQEVRNKKSPYTDPSFKKWYSDHRMLVQELQFSLPPNVRLDFMSEENVFEDEKNFNTFYYHADEFCREYAGDNDWSISFCRRQDHTDEITLGIGRRINLFGKQTHVSFKAILKNFNDNVIYFSVGEENFFLHNNCTNGLFSNKSFVDVFRGNIAFEDFLMQRMVFSLAVKQAFGIDLPPERD